MGEVWRATHDLLGREAAVKLVRFNGAGGSEGAEVERFQREAQALASLRSPHTLRLYEYGISPKFYLVTELLKGLDLESIVESFGPLPLARCIRLMRHACLSLAEAHAAGFFHRDVKPGNLFCCRRIGGEHDVLKVLDFGLVNAPLAAIGDGESHLTSPGVFLGTPQTSSPEAAKCRPDEIDAQSDLYSLGCTIYYLVTGGDVFRGPPLRVLMDHISKDPDPPSKRLGRQLPPEFDALIMSCLSKTKADRPADADEVIRRLDEIPIEDPWGPDEAQRWWSGRGVRPRSPEQARDADPTSALTP
ncbi:MAG: serine/threonine protein kinase [Planctomycetes bacterium]|nr:serine/threonine protein kinase [Planctomycetota bacterium]